MLQRAAELERQHQVVKPAMPGSGAAGAELDAADLERIAAESGLSAEAVRRALAEHRGGALARAGRQRDAETLQRTLDQSSDVAERRLSQLLRQSGLEPVERAPHATRWRPDGSLSGMLGRAVNWRGAGAFIGAEVESSVYEVGGGRCSAELRGNASGTVAPIAVVTGLLLAFPAAVAMLVVLAMGLRWGFSGSHSLAMLVVVLAWGGLTALVTRGVSRRRVRSLRRALERILKQLAGGSAPVHQVRAPGLDA